MIVLLMITDLVKIHACMIRNDIFLGGCLAVNLGSGPLFRKS